MSLKVDPYAVEVSGASTLSSSDSVNRISDPQLKKGRYSALARYVNAAAGKKGHHRHHLDSSLSSTDELVRDAFHRQRTATRQELSSAIAIARGKSRKPPERAHQIEISSDGWASSEQSFSSPENAHYLERLRRYLMEIKIKENPPLPETAPKPKRKISKAAIERLVAPNASVRAKRQEKFLLRSHREAGTKSKPVKISPVATKAGERLYSQAKAQQRMIAQMQAEALNRAKRTQEEACTFRPTISPYATRLAPSRDPAGFNLHLEQDKLQKEALARKRLEKEAAVLRSCPFRPTLSKETARILRRLREVDGRGRQGGVRPLPEDLSDVSEAAKRLYRDGGERLLRRQITAHRAKSADAARVVGGRRRLSRGGVFELLDRLEAWERARAARLLARRREEEKAQEAMACARGGDSAAKASRPPEGALRAASFEPPNRRFPRKAPPARGIRRTSLPYGSHDSDAREDSAERSPGSLSLSNTITVSALSAPTKPDDAWVKEKLLYDEMRRIRIGALFYKYTPSPQAETVSIADVQEKVRLLYPEDAGVLKALRTFIRSDHLALTKPRFMEALRRYEQQYGPQEWGRTEKDKILFPHFTLATAQHPPLASFTTKPPCERRPRQSAPGGLPPPAPVLPCASESEAPPRESMSSWFKNGSSKPGHFR